MVEHVTENHGVGSSILPLGTIFLLFAATFQAQVQPAPVQKPEPFVVSGCLHGPTLKTTRSNTSGVSVTTFRLRGPKQLMKALREYEGQEVEINGTLKDSKGRMGAARTKALGGRTKITVGIREDRNTEQPEDPELTVQSFRRLSPHCG